MGVPRAFHSAIEGKWVEIMGSIRNNFSSNLQSVVQENIC